MSTAFDAKAHLSASLKDAGYQLARDLRALPDEKVGVSPMGAGRTPMSIAVECISFNDWALRRMAGEEVEMHADFEAFKLQYDTAEKAASGLEESTDNLIAALEALDDEGLGRKAPPPWDPNVTAYAMFHVAASHMTYHDGQLNYVQTLYGDESMHWE